MTLRTDLLTLIEKQEPATARAFQAAIKDLTDRTIIRRLTAALRAGDVNAAIRALNIDKAVFQAMQANISGTFAESAILVTNATVWRLPDYSKAVIRWDMANPTAEAWVREQSSKLVTRVTEQTIEGVQTAIANGYATGRGPQSIALDIVGRIGPTGARTGGLLGLSGPQVDYVSNMRSRLLSGDPNELRKVLRMSKRDRRFDSAIRRAIASGKPMPVTQVDRLTQRYSARLLKLRGDTIARTETAHAVEAGRMDAFKQGMGKADIPPQAVYREWLHGGPAPSLARPDHAAMHNKKIVGLDDPWVVGGALMMHPLDTSMGAGPEHIVNCRCMQNIRIDYGYLNKNG